MTPKERDRFVDEKQKELNGYWQDTSLNDIIHIKTKEIKTPYLQRAAEEFHAIKLQPREVPGHPIDTTLRLIRLDRPSVSIEMLSLDRVFSIDNKEVNVKKEWKVKGSSGYYTVRLHGEKYLCNCKGFQFRKKCKHSELIREQNDSEG